ENDEDVRCGVLFGHGDHFTGGLDLAEVGPLVREGRLDEAFSGAQRRDPWRKDNSWTTPLVAAVQGWVMTLAIELLLAADIRIAAADARLHSWRSDAGSTRSAGRPSGCRATRAGATQCAGCSQATSTPPTRRSGSDWSKRS